MRRPVVIACLALSVAGLGVGFWPRPEVKGTAGPVEEPIPDFQAVEVTAPAQEGMTLAGVVKDSTGAAVPNATVSLAASGQASLSSLECGDCSRLLLSCPARETGQKVAS